MVNLLRLNRQTTPDVDQPKVLTGYAAIVVTCGLDLVLGRPSGSSKAVAPTMWCELFNGERSYGRALDTVQKVWADRTDLTCGVDEVIVIGCRPLPVEYWFLNEPYFSLDGAPRPPGVDELGVYCTRDLRRALDSEPELFTVTGAPPITRSVIEAHIRNNAYRSAGHRQFRS